VETGFTGSVPLFFLDKTELRSRRPHGLLSWRLRQLGDWLVKFRT
jgi:hypothetical protein